LVSTVSVASAGLVFRAACNNADIEVVGINDLVPVDYMAYMLKYDSVHGRFNGTIDYNVEKGQLIVNGNVIRVTAEKDPANLKWNEVGAEYIVESTGLFLTKEKAEAHIAAGAKYVVMSGPSGRYPDVRMRREHRQLRRPEDRFECIVHHELPRSVG